jgi:hypothetical protein
VTTHLPYAYRPENEFFHPFDGWLLMERSVVFDSWISWRHVLPIGRRDCREMTAEINQAILTLAGGLHQVHQRLPGYRDLGESPFRVSRWWDPFAEYPWNTGGTCVFRLDGCTADQFIALWSPSDSPVELEPTHELTIKAAIRSARPRPGGEPPPGRGQRHKSPTPHPETPGCLPQPEPISP